MKRQVRKRKAGMSTNRIAAYFLDFDGVIVDSVPIKTRAFAQLFRAYGDEVLAKVLEHHRQHGGISRIEKIRFVHEHILGSPLSERELCAWGRRYSRLVADEVAAADWIPGAREFLEQEKGHIPIFVISGTPEIELRQIIERRQMTDYFSEIKGSPTRKPEHVRNLLGRYELEPDQSVFVGDALTDYHTARETGLSFVGIQGDVEFPAGTVVLPDCIGLRETVHRMFQ